MTKLSPCFPDPRILLCSLLLLFVFPAANAKEWRLQEGPEDSYVLSAFPDPQKSLHYFGEYVFPSEATGGTKLHLFPNGRFVISEWSDIGPEQVVAVGSYRVRAERLTLQFTKLAPANEELRKGFSKLFLVVGHLRKESSTTQEAFIFKAEEWQKLDRAPGKAHYMIRQTEYPDWQRILREYTELAPK